MKYYKYKGDVLYTPFKNNKIYSENYCHPTYRSVGILRTNFPSCWQEVTPAMYYVQEGKMPEYFAIKRVECKLWYEYIKWWQEQFNSSGYDGDLQDTYYGLKSSYKAVNAFIKSTLPEDCIELTLEQWDQIVNKNEMKEGNKEIIGWKLKEDYKQYEKVILQLTNSDKLYNFAGRYNFGAYSEYANKLEKAGILELWFEPVYSQKFKVGDWVIIIQDCNFRGRTIQLTKDSFKYVISGYDVRLFGTWWSFPNQVRLATEEEIKAAQTLKFGGYDVTFEKVTSGIRITCNGETGTFSQIEAIYNYFKPNSTYFKFGSQEVKRVEYSSGAAWNLEYENEAAKSIKIGCTTGTWGEFVAIYDKAKSML